MKTFEEQWSALLTEAEDWGLEPAEPSLADWVSFVQRKGYEGRLHGDLLNKRIVDEIVRVRNRAASPDFEIAPAPLEVQECEAPVTLGPIIKRIVIEYRDAGGGLLAEQDVGTARRFRPAPPPGWATMHPRVDYEGGGLLVEGLSATLVPPSEPEM